MWNVQFSFFICSRFRNFIPFFYAEQAFLCARVEINLRRTWTEYQGSGFIIASRQFEILTNLHFADNQDLRRED